MKLFDVEAFLVLDAEDALVVEHETDAAARAEGSSALGEIAANVCNCPGVIVSGSLYEVSYSMRAVAFVHNLLEIALVLLEGFLDCPFDIVLRHVLAPGLSDEGPEPGVSGHIGTTLLDSNGDFLPDLGEGLGHVAPPLELPFLAELKRSSHDYFWLSMRVMYLSMS